jgi:protein-L-isoaspartate(D-aspartate) O-methyltransferase
MVTAAALEIPPQLLEQLKPNAKLVIPIGEKYGQELILAQKDQNNQLHTRKILDVSFVPLVKDAEHN